MVRTLDPIIDNQIRPNLPPQRRRGGYGARKAGTAIVLLAIVAWGASEVFGGDSTASGNTQATTTSQPNTSTPSTTFGETSTTIAREKTRAEVLFPELSFNEIGILTEAVPVTSEITGDDPEKVTELIGANIQRLLNIDPSEIPDLEDALDNFVVNDDSNTFIGLYDNVSAVAAIRLGYQQLSPGDILRNPFLFDMSYLNTVSAGNGAAKTHVDLSSTELFGNMFHSTMNVGPATASFILIDGTWRLDSLTQ